MITVGIASYNQQEFLPEAIDSALDQTVSCEIIVVNDGSTDHSLEIAKKYESKGVKVVNQVNKGLSSARNTAIMHMKGDYFLPLDADDCLKETCIEKMEKTIEGTHADVIACSFKTFGLINTEVVLNQIPGLEDFTQANRLGYFSAIKKEVILEVGGYSPRMVWGWEDYHLWLDIFKRNHSLAIIPEPLVLYRTKEHSMIHDANAHAAELSYQMRKDHPNLPWPSLQ